MKNYVISLKSATARREHISNEFGKKNVNFEFFDAITPNEIEATAKELDLNIRDTELTPGEIACLLSHVFLWKKAIDERLDYIAIFEDDIYLGDNADKFLNSDQWIPEGIDIIKLEAFSKYVNISYRSFGNSFDGRKLYRLNGAHLGCAGYILSYDICEKLMQLSKLYKKIIAVDHIVFEDYIKICMNNIYQLNPAICIQSDILNNTNKKIFISSLESDRRKRFDIKINFERKKIPLKDKVVREFFRVVKQFVKYYQHRRVKFK